LALAFSTTNRFGFKQGWKQMAVMNDANALPHDRLMALLKKYGRDTRRHIK
jgi:hypothetical protein